MTEPKRTKRYTGPAPFGFSWKDGCLVVQPSEAAIRKKAFEWFLENPNKGQVAKALNDAGHRTRKGSKIRDTQVDRWLTCPSAIGEYAVDRSSKGVDLPKEEWTFIEGPSIIKRELWESVQEILRVDAPSSRSGPAKKVSRSEGDPLAPLVYCSCGASMVFDSSGRKFACRQCKRRIPREDLEAIVLEDVRAYLLNRKDILQALLDTPAPVLEAEDRLREHEERLRKVVTDMGRIHELFMSSAIGVERFGELHQPREREELRRETPELERALAGARRDYPQTESEELNVDGLIDLWSELPFEARRVILTELFERVVVGDGEIHIRGRLPTTPLRTESAQQAERPTSGAPNKRSAQQAVQEWSWGSLFTSPCRRLARPVLCLG